MHTESISYEIGCSLAASNRGIDYSEMKRRQAGHAVMCSPEAIPFERQLCKIAVDMGRASGDFSSPTMLLFQRLEKSAVWHSSYSRFTDKVREALAYLRKEAMASIIPATIAMQGEGAVKTLTAGGLLGGAALGSLAFMLSRNATQSSAENAALMEKIKAYKKLRRDIEEDMVSDMQAMPAPKPKAPRYDV